MHDIESQSENYVIVGLKGGMHNIESFFIHIVKRRRNDTCGEEGSDQEPNMNLIRSITYQVLRIQYQFGSRAEISLMQPSN